MLKKRSKKLKKTWKKRIMKVVLVILAWKVIERLFFSKK